MKRFLLFTGEIYYASGGMEDFKADFDTLEEVVKIVESNLDNGEPWLERGCWAHIYDSELKRIVWNNGKSAQT